MNLSPRHYDCVSDGLTTAPQQNHNHHSSKGGLFRTFSIRTNLSDSSLFRPKSVRTVVPVNILTNVAKIDPRVLKQNSLYLYLTKMLQNGISLCCA